MVPRVRVRVRVRVHYTGRLRTDVVRRPRFLAVWFDHGPRKRFKRSNHLPSVPSVILYERGSRCTIGGVACTEVLDVFQARDLFPKRNPAPQGPYGGDVPDILGGGCYKPTK